MYSVPTYGRKLDGACPPTLGIDAHASSLKRSFVVEMCAHIRKIFQGHRNNFVGISLTSPRFCL